MKNAIVKYDPIFAEKQQKSIAQQVREAVREINIFRAWIERLRQ